MNEVTMNEVTTVSSWVNDRFSRTELFEMLGIDFCCGGNKTLQEACEEKGLCIDDVLRKLEQWNRSCPITDCNHMDASELCNHIETTHHAYLKRMFPLVQGHLERIVKSHGEKYLELKETFARFTEELESHMKKEETLVFPAIRSNITQNHQIFGKLEEEHRLAGTLLASIRKLTNNFTLPPKACMTLKTTWAELEEIERDVHKHVYKENYLLFPLIIGQKQDDNPPANG